VKFRRRRPDLPRRFAADRPDRLPLTEFYSGSPKADALGGILTGRCAPVFTGSSSPMVLFSLRCGRGWSAGGLEQAGGLGRWMALGAFVLAAVGRRGSEGRAAGGGIGEVFASYTVKRLDQWGGRFNGSFDGNRSTAPDPCTHGRAASRLYFLFRRTGGPRSSPHSGGGEPSGTGQRDRPGSRLPRLLRRGPGTAGTFYEATRTCSASPRPHCSRAPNVRPAGQVVSATGGCRYTTPDSSVTG